MYAFAIKKLIEKCLFSGLILFCLNDFKLAAQELPADSTDKVEQVPVWPEDSLGRRSPKGTVNGFIRAIALKDYHRAGQYLQLDSLQSESDRIPLAKGLEYLLEVDGRLYPSSRLSDDLEGMKDDGKDPDFDQVGSFVIDGNTVDLMVKRTSGEDGNPVWLFSSETVGKIPLQSENATEESLVENVSPPVLKKHLWGGIPVAHWLGMLLIIAFSYLLALVIIRGLIYLIPLVWKRARKEPVQGIMHSFVWPLKLYLTVVFFIIGSRWAGVSIIVRQQFSDLALIAAVIAFLLLIWQLMNYGSRYMELRMKRKHNYSAISAILFVRRAAKLALILLGVLVILDTFGLNVTTWLAGLGIVGIALALGTQKTVENFVGSVTLIADQPVRVGDFCKAGEVSGTVERIGMRTTSIRTNDRTVVSIPNGEFSSMKIENFSPRDRFLFQTVLTLHIQTATLQVREILTGLRKVLTDHPKVTPDPARVRLIEILPDGYRIEIFSYVDTIDGNEFLEIREELYLSMTEVVNSTGASFAMPLQPVLVTGGNNTAVSPDEEDK